MLQLDRALWYAGFDGELMAELIPAKMGWYVVLLGNGLFATTDRCYLDRGVMTLLTNGGFKTDRGVWTTHATEAYSHNPFLREGAIHQSLKLTNLGQPTLPVDPLEYPLIVFTPKRPETLVPSLLCFVITQDCQFVRWGKSRNPTRFLTQLQAQSPQPLRLLGTLKHREQSRDWGKNFQEYKSLGNWYHFRGDLAKTIERLLSKD